MVFVNNKKYACESCIKGHRSSTCHHTDRPLFEIQKKGRPVSQCPKCRELRQSRRVHSKCQCPQQEQPSRGILLPSSSSKSRRYLPIKPALPNGLRDVLPVSTTRSLAPPDSRQRVDSLLNPCNCRSGSKCKCRADDPPIRLGASAKSAPAPCCGPTSCCGGQGSSSSKRQTSRPNSPSHKRSKHKHLPSAKPTPGPDLPPLLLDEFAIPTFATMPPMSTIASLAGSGCTCGVECACPGCVVHRGPEHVDSTRPSCADGCGTCVDSSAGVEAPSGDALGLSGFGYAFPSETSSSISQFLARAAALPLPPIHSKQRVNLPKLECCGGHCSCPADSCSCGKSCDGGCTEHRSAKLADTPLDVVAAPESSVPDIIPATPIPSTPPRSCCC
ncbi:Copper-fist domain-containing protein [Mycena indigotica]|uniref:Copper-fist domain-containing protein n=1 Tax=Mycena indigotica TaxID=2126181 RepID=A0A8H6WBH8_9AGAR|nr:Copper-fist domain-containing protein [Mycena indigotica]KAF7306384.1 Copper-fist domain-containing protein [Mycena indigotica]